MRTYNPDATCPKCDSADIATRSHTCVHSEVVYWRDGWRIRRDGWRIYQFYDNCLTCGRSLAAPWLTEAVRS